MLYTELENRFLLGTKPGTYGDWLYNTVRVKTIPHDPHPSFTPKNLRKLYPVGLATLMRGVYMLKPYISIEDRIIVTSHNRWQKHVDFIVSGKDGEWYNATFYSCGSIFCFAIDPNGYGFNHPSVSAADFINNIRKLKRCLEGKEEFEYTVHELIDL